MELTITYTADEIKPPVPQWHEWPDPPLEIYVYYVTIPLSLYVYREANPMLMLHATRDRPPLAVLKDKAQWRGYICAWEDLRSLAALISSVSPGATLDEDYPVQRNDPWLVSGSSLGIALTYGQPDGWTIHLEAEKWRQLTTLLFVGDDLLTVAEVVELSGRPQPRISEAVAAGRLFAFQEGKSLLIPRGAVTRWMSDRDTGAVNAARGL